MSTLCIRTLCAYFILCTTVVAQQSFDGWRILRQEEDGTVIMEYIDREAVVEHEVNLEVNSRGRVKSVSFNLPRGRSKDGSHGEINHYWNHRRGINAWWQYMHKNDNVHIHRPSQKQKVPVQWYGRLVAFVTKTGQHYVGRLRAIEDSKSWFALEIEGGIEPMKFHYEAVKEIHALR
ncbi:MAG: hypothetical protein ACLFSB_09590 [Chitinispirillaceae bacterium]